MGGGTGLLFVCLFVLELTESEREENSPATAAASDLPNCFPPNVSFLGFLPSTVLTILPLAVSVATFPGCHVGTRTGNWRGQ